MITATPATYDIDNAIGYTTNGKNFPGLLGLQFDGTSTIGGFGITGQLSLLSLDFLNLASIPAGALCSFAGNPAMTNLSFPELTSCAPALVISASFSPCPALASLNIPKLVTASGGIILANASALTSFSAPALTSAGAALQIINGNNLASISLPVFNHGTHLTFNSNPVLTSLILPNLSSLTGNIVLTGCIALATVSFPNFLPANGTSLNFGLCALVQGSVDHILSRAVANPAYVTGTITLNGGSNSPPSAVGIIDRDALIARGCTVITN